MVALEAELVGQFSAKYLNSVCYAINMHSNLPLLVDCGLPCSHTDTP